MPHQLVPPHTVDIDGAFGIEKSELCNAEAWRSAVRGIATQHRQLFMPYACGFAAGVLAMVAVAAAVTSEPVIALEPPVQIALTATSRVTQFTAPLLPVEEHAPEQSPAALIVSAPAEIETGQPVAREVSAPSLLDTSRLRIGDLPRYAGLPVSEPQVNGLPPFAPPVETGAKQLAPQARTIEEPAPASEETAAALAAPAIEVPIRSGAAPLRLPAQAPPAGFVKAKPGAITPRPKLAKADPPRSTIAKAPPVKAGNSIATKIAAPAKSGAAAATTASVSTALRPPWANHWMRSTLGMQPRGQ
jgi:hypothetical protein